MFCWTATKHCKSFERLCQYVINRTRQQFSVGDLSRCAASSVDHSITDYNKLLLYFVASRRTVPLACGVDTIKLMSLSDAAFLNFHATLF